MRTIAALSALLALTACSVNPSSAPRESNAGTAAGAGQNWSLSAANQALTATRRDMEDRAPSEFRGLYYVGVDALSCVEAVSLPTAASIDRIAGGSRERLKEALEGLSRSIANASGQGRGADLEMAINVARDRQAAGYQATAAANRILGAEGPMAAEVRVATERVRRAVTSRLNDFHGNSGDVLAASRPVVQLGLNTMTDAQAQLSRVSDSRRAALMAGFPGASDGSADAVTDLEAKGQQLLGAIAEIQAAIEGPAQSARAAVKLCKFDDLTSAVALQLLPAGELTVHAGETRNFSVSGGKGPYAAYFVDHHPEKVELVVPTSADGNFGIRALKGAAEGRPFTILVQDLGSSAQAVVTGKTATRAYYSQRPTKRR